MNAILKSKNQLSSYAYFFISLFEILKLSTNYFVLIFVTTGKIKM